MLAAAVVALATWLESRREPASAPGFALSTLAPSSVTRIVVEIRNQPPFVLENESASARSEQPKGAEIWRIRTPAPVQGAEGPAPSAGYRADPYRVAALTQLLLARSEIELPAVDLARFGLDEPQVRLRFDGQEFALGGRQPLNDRVYVLTRGKVYLVSPVYALHVSRGMADFLAKKPLAEEERPVAFDLPDWRLFERDGRWQVEPADARLDADRLNAFVDEWRLATALAVEPRAKPTVGEPIRLALRDGRRIVFYVAAREPELVLWRSDEGLAYHFVPETGAILLDPLKVPEPR